jgi:cell division protein FtsB
MNSYIVIKSYTMKGSRGRNDALWLMWRRIIMIVLIFFILFALWAVVDVFQKEQDSRTLRQQAEAQLHDLEKREIALKARIESLETLRGQEAALRDAYNVGKEGEGVVQIVDKEATSTETVSHDSASFLRKIFWWW